jgi:hypothetical protein
MYVCFVVIAAAFCVMPAVAQPNSEAEHLDSLGLKSFEYYLVGDIHKAVIVEEAACKTDYSKIRLWNLAHMEELDFRLVEAKMQYGKLLIYEDTREYARSKIDMINMVINDTKSREATVYFDELHYRRAQYYDITIQCDSSLNELGRIKSEEYLALVKSMTNYIRLKCGYETENESAVRTKEPVEEKRRTDTNSGLSVMKYIGPGGAVDEGSRIDFVVLDENSVTMFLSFLNKSTEYPVVVVYNECVLIDLETKEKYLARKTNLPFAAVYDSINVKENGLIPAKLYINQELKYVLMFELKAAHSSNFVLMCDVGANLFTINRQGRAIAGQVKNLLKFDFNALKEVEIIPYSKYYESPEYANCLFAPVPDTPFKGNVKIYIDGKYAGSMDSGGWKSVQVGDAGVNVAVRLQANRPHMIMITDGVTTRESALMLKKGESHILFLE